MQLITLEILKQRRIAALMASERAIRQQGDRYREIKKLVRQINDRVVDVEDYHKTASRLGCLLRCMAAGGENTIFDYFAEKIDPDRQGNPRYFRLECLDLAEQLEQLDQWRASRRNLTQIK